MDYPQLPQKRSRQQVYNDTMPQKMVKLEAEKKQPEPLAEEKRMLETRVQTQDEVIAKEKAKTQLKPDVRAREKRMFEAKIQMQNEVIAEQKAKAQMYDEAISKQKAMFEAKLQMQDEVISKQKAMFETKLQTQNEVIAEHKAKLQIQDEVITKQESMLEAAKLQHENLTSLIVKCKITELRVQVESGNPDYEVIHSMGNDLKSVMSMIPESLRVVVEAEFSFQYVQLKSLFFTRIDASQWAKIETELGYTRDSETSRLKAIHSESHVPAAKLPPAPKPSSSNHRIATSSSIDKSEYKVIQPSKSSRK